MKPMDLSELIKGLMVVIAIALAVEKLPELKQWAITQAFSRDNGFVERRHEKRTGMNSIAEKKAKPYTLN